MSELPFPRLFRLRREVVRVYEVMINARWLLLGALTGVFAGLAAILFFTAVEGLKFVLVHKLAGIQLPAPAGEEIFFGASGEFRPWLVVVFMTAAGLVSGFLISRFVPECIDGGTDGTDSMIDAFHRKEGVVGSLVALIRSSTAVLTIGAGGSAGREGPISLLGAGIGSFLARRLKLRARERRILLLAGAAGGLGAIFRAPLGGALTAVEVIYREDFEAEAMLPAVVSSVVAYSIFTLAFGSDPIFGIPHFEFSSIRELPFYALLAVVCAVTGWFYIRTFRFIKYKMFWPVKNRWGITASLTLGGFLMGVIGMFFPEVLTGGYGWLEAAILGKMSVAMMLGILVGKTLATSVTLGSGLSGGMFAPALFVGGMSGGLVGSLSHRYFPEIVAQPGGYVLVGMAAFFAGVAKAPVGPLIMVCELTQGYGLLAPLMLSSALCLVLSRTSFLYENQVDNKFESPAHIEDATINILESMPVRDYFQPGRVTTMEESTSFTAMTDIMANANELYFPVRDHRDRITSIVSVQDLRNVLFEDCLCDLLVAKDVARKAALLTPEDDLYRALLLFVETDFGQIPVVNPEDQTEVLGLLAREDVFKAYAQMLKQIKGSEAAAGV
ncbi:MAG: chloride channel protein [Desulfonatronovibrionaceae bacterium]